MNDRLAELRGTGEQIGRVDIEVGTLPPGGSSFMQAFFDDVQEIKKAMSTIRYNIRQIEQNHGECLTAISVEQGRASTERLDELMKTTNATATQVCITRHQFYAAQESLCARSLTFRFETS